MADRCATGGCVDVTAENGWILVRDTKNPEREPLAYRPSAWMSTVLAPVMLRRTPPDVDVTDSYVWRGHTVEGVPQAHVFTGPEWEEFGEGVRAGEFNPEALSRGVIGQEDPG